MTSAARTVPAGRARSGRARTGRARGSRAVRASLVALLLAGLAGCVDAPVGAEPGGGSGTPGAPPAAGAPAVPSAPSAPSPGPGPAAPPPAPAPAAEARPAVAPVTAVPSGRTVDLGSGPVRSLVVAPRDGTVVAGTTGPDQLVTVDPDAGTVAGRTSVDVPPGRLAPTTDRSALLVTDPAGTAVLTTPVPSTSGSGSASGTTGTARTGTVTVGPGARDAVALANGDVVVALAGDGSGRDGSLAVVRDARVVRTVPGLGRPTALATFGTTLAVLDTASASVRLYDTTNGAPTGTLPAGTGPTHLTVDRHGRLWVTDTAGGALLGYDLAGGRAPLPRLVVGDPARPGAPTAPFATAYDAGTDRLWVTLTGTNQVVGYDLAAVAGPGPRELLRLPTVARPEQLALAAGHVLVAGPDGSTLQVLTP